MTPLLTHDDRHSPAVVKLRKFLEAELTALRRRNDKHRTETDTAGIRGEIARIKAILALCEEPRTVKTPED